MKNILNLQSAVASISAKSAAVPYRACYTEKGEYICAINIGAKKIFTVLERVRAVQPEVTLIQVVQQFRANLVVNGRGEYRTIIVYAAKNTNKPQKNEILFSISYITAGAQDYSNLEILDAIDSIDEEISSKEELAILQGEAALSTELDDIASSLIASLAKKGEDNE